jgi:hypothetical protein
LHEHRVLGRGLRLSRGRRAALVSSLVCSRPARFSGSGAITLGIPTKLHYIRASHTIRGERLDTDGPAHPRCTAEHECSGRCDTSPVAEDSRHPHHASSFTLTVMVFANSFP